MSKIRILWKDIKQAEWEKVITTLPRSNLYQDWDYGEAASSANGVKIHRALICRDQKPIGLVQGFEKRYIFGLKLVRFIRGPLFIETAKPTERLRCYTGIKKSCRMLKGQLATILPELRYNDEIEKSLKSVNLNRVLSGTETSWLQLTLTQEQLRQNLSKSWQRDIKQAKKHDIQIDFNGSLNDILTHHTQHKTSKEYHADNVEIYKDMPVEKLAVVNAIEEGKIIASALFIFHGNSATYQIGWASEAARKSNAQKVLMWQSILYLKEKNIKWLDLGAMDSKSAPGVAKFKQGMGGDAFILCGTYI